MLKMGISGLEGYEMCRFEEVSCSFKLCKLYNYIYINIIIYN